MNRRGEPVYGVSYPNARGGSGVPKEVKVEQTFGMYISNLSPPPLFFKEGRDILLCMCWSVSLTLYRETDGTAKIKN